VYTRKEKKNCRDLRHVCIDGGLEIVGIILTVIAESEESEIVGIISLLYIFTTHARFASYAWQVLLFIKISLHMLGLGP